jgi:hypothetical protein
VIATAEYAHLDTIHGVWYQAINLGPGNGTLPDGRISYWGSTDPTLWTGTNPNQPTGYSTLQRTGSNPAFGGQSTFLTNTGKGEGNFLTLQLATPFHDEGFSGSAAMTLGRATEVNPGTSSQAFSNFSGRAAFNPNDNIAYRSNYDVKGRLLGALTWQHHFWGDYATSVSAFYDGHSGQPYSFVYGNDANGDGVSNNDLFFVPRPGQAQFVNGTPQSVIDKLNGEVVRIVNAPDVRPRLESQGVDIVGSTPAGLAAFIKEEIAKYARLVKAAGIKVE